MIRRVLRTVRRYIITGTAVMVPIALTAYVIWLTFSLIDNVLGGLVALFVGQRIPGVGAALTLILLFAVGLFAANVVGSSIIRLGERILATIPLVRNVYTAAKQLTQALTTRRKENFNRVVLVEFPRKGTYSIGFVTNGQAGAFSRIVDEEVVTVFVPTAPNPTTGFFFGVPPDEVYDLPISVEDGFKLILSAGLIVPEDLKEAEEGGPVSDGKEPGSVRPS